MLRCEFSRASKHAPQVLCGGAPFEAAFAAPQDEAEMSAPASGHPFNFLAHQLFNQLRQIVVKPLFQQGLKCIAGQILQPTISAHLCH